MGTSNSFSIMMIGNGFINTDIVSYGTAQAIMEQVDEVDHCWPLEMAKTQQALIIKFVKDIVARDIDRSKIQGYIKKFRNDGSTHQAVSSLCSVLANIKNMYSAGYSASDVNEARLV